jgi:hypothetical protein
MDSWPWVIRYAEETIALIAAALAFRYMAKSVKEFAAETQW